MAAPGPRLAVAWDVCHAVPGGGTPAGWHVALWALVMAAVVGLMGPVHLGNVSVRNVPARKVSVWFMRLTWLLWGCSIVGGCDGWQYVSSASAIRVAGAAYGEHMHLLLGRWG